MKKNAVVTLADAGYVEQAKQLFSSIYHNAGWQGDYLLLAHQIPEEELKWFTDRGILVYRCKPLADKPFGPHSRRKPTVLSKFYLFTPFFKQWDRIIFLDGDIIVRASLDDLTQSKGFNAVKMPHSLWWLFFMTGLRIAIFNPEQKALAQQLRKKYNLRTKSFNSGVMVFSSDFIQPDTFSRLFDIYQKYKTILYGDEPMFNLAFQYQWRPLPQAYNVLIHLLNMFYKIKPDEAQGIVMHFCTPEKPWRKNHPCKTEWETNLSRADNINLKNPLPPKEVWSPKKINALTRFVFWRDVKDFRLLWHYKFNRRLGLAGLTIKAHNPRLYWWLKLLLKGQRPKN